MGNFPVKEIQAEWLVELIRDTYPPNEILFDELKKEIHKEVGKKLEIIISETKEIKKERAREYPPLIKSYVKDNLERC